jgi:ectoine hydroxylase-related dioxygenase (phytanoyl-CoA dioxygenase family)
MPATLTARASTAVSAAEIANYERDGFHVARAHIPQAEVAAMIAHYHDLHARAPIYEVYEPKKDAADPLVRYPRMMQPHRYDPFSKRYLLDPRTLGVLRALIGDEPLAAQSMMYFKPPLAEGQGFHQDNFYLLCSPGSCYAAWLALDDTDAGNGSLYVVPGSHRRRLGNVENGEAGRWGGTTPEPRPEETVEVRMRAGDCLFFHGNLIHGSQKNESATRWRRSYICHYVGQSGSERIAAYYHPIFKADGTVSDIGADLGMPVGWHRD